MAMVKSRKHFENCEYLARFGSYQGRNKTFRYDLYIFPWHVWRG
jgi:hypothetical protein